MKRDAILKLLNAHWYRTSDLVDQLMQIPDDPDPRAVAPSAEMIEESWKFWDEILKIPEPGIAPYAQIIAVNMDQLKKELADFSFILHEVPLVYEHITGGLLSKCNYIASTVKQVADDHFNARIKEAVMEFINHLQEEGLIELSPSGKDGVQEESLNFFG